MGIGHADIDWTVYIALLMRYIGIVNDFLSRHLLKSYSTLTPQSLLLLKNETKPYNNNEIGPPPFLDIHPITTMRVISSSCFESDYSSLAVALFKQGDVVAKLKWSWRGNYNNKRAADAASISTFDTRRK